ncbi:transcription initiation factor IIB [Nitrosopumilus piranensis]|uniref:Transcription factor TFIIB cyclin-related protein n=1 Tax=Nitrosopumilus piranensis TaxID=1582439 RepID=A0A0C5CAS8_9ARCH|nr:transcription factor TFIIB [Nitrosopumilus piranensis]AJM92287.1 Transcription factor TFIIB cyclin-related protein [Nitrosopumilus piranensis]
MKQILEYCFKNKHTSPITDINTGEVCCSDCGMVLKEKIVDQTNGPGTFTNEDYLKNVRNGPPSKIAMSNMSKSSVISKKNIDAVGKRILSDNKAHFSRMRLWDSRSKNSSKERNLMRAFTVLDAYASKLSIPENGKEHAAYIYRKAVSKDIIRGSSIPSMMAASVYAACKQLGIPRSMDDTSKVADISKKKLSRTYKRLVKNLELKVSSFNTDYVSKISNTLAVSEKTARLAAKIIYDLKKENLHVGKNPIGITAASLYLSAINYDEHISMQKISKKTNISTVTIRKMTRLLRPFAAKYLKSIDIEA